MAVDILHGAFKMLFVYRENSDGSPGKYYPIGCLINNSFSEGTKMLETTVRSNMYGWESSRPIGQNYSVNFEGYLPIQTEAFTFRELQDLKRGMKLVDMKLVDLEAWDAQDLKGYIISLSEDAPADGLITFSGTLKGVGMPSYGDVPVEDFDFTSSQVTWDRSITFDRTKLMADELPPLNID